ncbi:hypothetical protein MMPV_003155 [Pyropia vietnamensis]
MWCAIPDTGGNPLVDAASGADWRGDDGGGGDGDGGVASLPPLSPLRSGDDGVVPTSALPAELGDGPACGDGGELGGNGGSNTPGFPLSPMLGGDGRVSQWLSPCSSMPATVEEPGFVDGGARVEAWSPRSATPPSWANLQGEGQSNLSPLLPCHPAEDPAVSSGVLGDVNQAPRPVVTPIKVPQPAASVPPYGRLGPLKSSGGGVEAEKATVFHERMGSLDTEAREWLFPEGLSCPSPTAGSGGGDGAGEDGPFPDDMGVDPLFLQPLHVSPEALSAGLYREKTVLSCRTGRVLNSMAMLIVPSRTTATGWLLGWVFSEWAENNTASLEIDVPPCTSPVTRVALNAGKTKVALSAYFEDGAHVQFDWVEAIPNSGGVNKEQYVVRRGSGRGPDKNRARIIHATVSHMEQRVDVADQDSSALRGPFRPRGEDGGMLGPLATGHYFGGIVNALAGMRLTDNSGSATPPRLPPTSQLLGLSGWRSSFSDSLLSTSSMVTDASEPVLPTATQFELHVDIPGYLTRLRLRAAALSAVKPRVPVWRPLGEWEGGARAPRQRLAVCAPSSTSPPYASDLPTPFPEEWSRPVPDIPPAAPAPAPPSEPFALDSLVEGVLPAFPMDWAARVPLNGNDDDGDSDLAAAAAAAKADWIIPAAAESALLTHTVDAAASVVPAQSAIPAVASGRHPGPPTCGAAPAAPIGTRACAVTSGAGRALPIAPAGRPASAAVPYPAAAALTAGSLGVAAATAAGTTTTASGPLPAVAATGPPRRRSHPSPDAVANPVRYARMLRNRESARRSNERRRMARLAARAAREAERQASEGGSDCATSTVDAGRGGGGSAASGGGVG